MPTEIYYNDSRILSDQPTPIVGIQDTMIRYGERFAESRIYNLRGQITGCPKNFLGLIDKQKELINIFAKDFQSIKIFQDSTLIDSHDYCIIRNGVRFPQSKYVGILDYEVDIEVLPPSLFSGFYGVLDPEDTWEFEETSDKRLRVKRNISARGFNTSSGATNALQNAKYFVKSRTGVDYIAQPYFINLPVNFGVCLRSIEETENRFSATYGISLIYEGDLYYNYGGVTRYTTSIDCDNENGLTTVSVNGDIQGCKMGSISDVRNLYSNINIYNIANSGYQSFNGGVLNSGYLSSGIVEDPSIPKLSFKIDFDNFTGANVFFNYKVDINSGENDVITVGVNGEAKARGNIHNKWSLVSGYYSSINLYSIANSAYTDYGGTSTLNPLPNSSGITFNKFVGEIGLNATFDDKSVGVDGFAILEYNLDYIPSLQRVSAVPLVTDANGPVCSNYTVTDLNYKNRAVFSINGNGRVDCNTSMATAVTNLKNTGNALFSLYCPTTRAVLENYRITTGTTNNISFSFTWSAESPFNVVTPRSDYDDINELKLK